MALGAIITIISVVVAIASALFAWKAVKTAEKTYSVELIGQLYTIYQSDEMFHDLEIVWGIYRQIWQSDSDIEEMAKENVNKGIPIRDNSAINYFLKLDRNSAEFKAIHRLVNFWTYLELLLKRKALKPEEISAFTSPKILGCLYPMAKAYGVRFGREPGKKNILEYTYKTLGVESS